MKFVAVKEFDDYISALQNRLQRDGKITVYEDVLDRLAEDEEPAAQPRMPNFPLPVSK